MKIFDKIVCFFKNKPYLCSQKVKHKTHTAMNTTIISNELYNALHIIQEANGSFDDMVDAVAELLAFIRRNGGEESKVANYLQRWLDQKGGTEQERYDRLAAFWCGLEAGRTE